MGDVSFCRGCGRGPLLERQVRWGSWFYEDRGEVYFKGRLGRHNSFSFDSRCFYT